METEQPRFERLKQEERALRTAVKERISTAMTGAFGLVAALAWNDAVKSAIEYFYPPQEGAGIGPKFLYAIIVTLIVAIAVYILTKFFESKESAKKI